MPRFLHTDVTSNEDGTTTIKIDAPGVSKDDVKVDIDHHTLTITAKRGGELDTNEDGVHRVERWSGTASRSFSLAPNVDASKIDAALTDGVLTITLPSAEERRPTFSIDVK